MADLLLRRSVRPQLVHTALPQALLQRAAIGKRGADQRGWEMVGARQRLRMDIPHHTARAKAAEAYASAA